MYHFKPVTAAEQREALIIALMRELEERPSGPLSRSQIYETLDALAHCAALAIKSKNARRCAEQADFFAAALDRHFRDVALPAGSHEGVEIQRQAAEEALA